MDKNLLIGISEIGITHTTSDAFDIDTRFKMVRDAGVFDYIDASPPLKEIDIYRDAVQRYGIPLTAGGYYYILGRDEPLLKRNMQISAELGTRIHNVLILAFDSNGRPVSNEQIATAFMNAMEWGAVSGTVPSFEVHVGMWSEKFQRVQQVAEMVEATGATFNLTLDHSHVLFPLGSEEAQNALGIREAVEEGLLELDPFESAYICQQWIEMGIVYHAHARSAAPNGPRNFWMTGPDGKPGLPIQYPFIQPKAGQWHSTWNEDALGPWKQAICQLLSHRANFETCRFNTISTEFIPYADYGGGAKYSLFENNVACGQWLRDTWRTIQSGP